MWKVECISLLITNFFIPQSCFIVYIIGFIAGAEGVALVHELTFLYGKSSKKNQCDANYEWGFMADAHLKINYAALDIS